LEARLRFWVGLALTVSGMDVSGPDFTEDLLRFALLRTGNRQVAFELAQRASAEGEAIAGQWRTRRHLFLWAARFVADRMESLPPCLPKGSDLPPELDSILRAASPRLRSALALHYIADFKLNELSQVVRVRPREMRAALAEVRQKMAQAGFSECQLREQVRLIALSAEERLLLKATATGGLERRFGAERALGVAAVCLGVFMFLGWVAWERWRESEPVQMRAQMQRILDASSASGLGGVELFKGSAAETPDWLFLHGMEGVQVPKCFAVLRLASARMVDFNGGKFAQFTIEDSKGVLNVALADALGLGGVRTGNGRTTSGEWSGAWEVSGPYVFFLTVKDAEAQLDKVLKTEMVRF
jgi:hypothetical protein